MPLQVLEPLTLQTSKLLPLGLGYPQRGHWITRLPFLQTGWASNSRWTKSDLTLASFPASIHFKPLQGAKGRNLQTCFCFNCVSFHLFNFSKGEVIWTNVGMACRCCFKIYFFFFFFVKDTCIIKENSLSLEEKTNISSQPPVPCTTVTGFY